MSVGDTLSFRSAAAESPDRAAVVVAGRSLSYAELAARVEAATPKPEDAGFVTLSPRLDLDSLITIWACLERQLPLALFSPRWPESLRRTRREALARGLSTTPELATDRVLAYVHTSGSSAEPKAVALSRAAFVASAAASEANLGWQESDRWLLALPLAHVGGLSIVTRCLVARRTLVLLDHATQRGFEPDAVGAQLVRDRVSLASLVPTMLERLLRLEPAVAPPPSLRAVLLGGARCDASLLRRACDAGYPVLTTYGMTETCAQVVTQEYARRGQIVEGVGRALSGWELRVRDGHVEVRGAALMDGYVGEPRERTFTEDGFFRTQDRGRLLDGGRLVVLGRADAAILSGGENVAPAEVEAALEALPEVERALAFGVRDAEWGERVCAAVVLRRDYAEGVDLRALSSRAAARLPPAARPRSLVVLDALPLTDKGSVDRPEAVVAARRALAAQGGSPP